MVHRIQGIVILMSVLQYMQIILALGQTEYVRLIIASYLQVSFWISSMCTNGVLKGYKIMWFCLIYIPGLFEPSVHLCAFKFLEFSENKKKINNFNVENILAADTNQISSATRNICFCLHPLFDLCTLVFMICFFIF